MKLGLGLPQTANVQRKSEHTEENRSDATRAIRSEKDTYSQLAIKYF